MAGGLLVHKMDLIPVAILLVVAYGVRLRRIPFSTIAISLSLGAIWYIFAWCYFGSFLPNSLITKIKYQAAFHYTIDWRWFGSSVLIAGIHKYLSLFSGFTIASKDHHLNPTKILLGGTLFVHLAVYTVKYPFEPYNWYTIPSVFSLLVLGSIGASLLRIHLIEKFPYVPIKQELFWVIITAGVLCLGLRGEMQATSNIKHFLKNAEFDRSEAGRWVQRNTPAGFTVFTYWGNPAYYSKRKVIDGSFLNRPYESNNLIRTYKPEVLILQNSPGSTPQEPVFPIVTDSRYEVVRVFDHSCTAGLNFFYAVLARDDVISRIKNVKHPVSILAHVKNKHLGDQDGLINATSSNTLFVHPGLHEATTFDFDVGEYLLKTNKDSFVLESQIAPWIPPEAVSRGAGVVHVIVASGHEVLFDETLTPGRRIVKEFDMKITAGTLNFTVDNCGHPDTNWLLLTFR